jgi:hypothetical protein
MISCRERPTKERETAWEGDIRDIRRESERERERERESRFGEISDEEDMDLAWVFIKAWSKWCRFLKRFTGTFNNYAAKLPGLWKMPKIIHHFTVTLQSPDKFIGTFISALINLSVLIIKRR